MDLITKASAISLSELRWLLNHYCMNIRTVYDCTLYRIILCMHPANERWCYTVTPSLIGWAHTQNDPCLWFICTKCTANTMSCYWRADVVPYKSRVYLNTIKPNNQCSDKPEEHQGALPAIPVAVAKQWGDTQVEDVMWWIRYEGVNMLVT